MLEHVLRRIELPVILIPHVMMSAAIFPSNDDFLFMQELIGHIEPNLRHRVLLYDARNHTSKQIKGVISRCKVFAGFRTHATIAALSSQVPTFCIGYSVKAQGINQDIFGHENWIAHFSELSGHRLAERIELMLREESPLRSHLATVIPPYAEQAWLNGQYLKEMLERREGK